MVAGKLKPQQKLEFNQGARWAASFTCFDTYIAVGDPGNVPTDITGFHFALSIRVPTSEDAEVFKATDGDYLTVGTTDGVVSLSVPKSITEAIPAFAEGVFELQLTPLSGAEYTDTVLTGKVVNNRWVNR